MTDSDPAAYFWTLAATFLEQPDVDRGTMMGFPCLRVEGAFCACAHRTSGDLIVKLSRERVVALIAEGTGQPFAPAGRTFREWVQVDRRDEVLWRGLIDEAVRRARDGSGA